MKMLEQRWIAVRERQARLRREADRERLGRAARNGHPKDGSAARIVAFAASEPRMQPGNRLATAVAGSLRADVSLSTCECSEA
jgi:hypothetical protein